MRTHRRRYFLDGGMVLMYALSVLVIVSVIGLSLQTTGSSLMQLGKEGQYRRLAQHAADSGLRYGTAYVRSILDPVSQYATIDPLLANPTTLTDTQYGHHYVAGNTYAVHPCDIYWRLNAGLLQPGTFDAARVDNSVARKVDDWIRGDGAVFGQQLANIPLDPTLPAGASNPLLYVTSFVLSIQAVCIRTMAGLPAGVVPQPGRPVNVGIRWRDLVDQSGAQYCHQSICATSNPTSLPTTWVPPGASYPPESDCWHKWDSPVPTSFTTATGACTFRYTQPYVLTCTGTVYVNDPANPGQIKNAAIATVVATQLITVSCRDKSTPDASMNSTYVVTAANQER